MLNSLHEMEQSTTEIPDMKRGIATREEAVAMDVFKGKIKVINVAPEYDCIVSEVENWIEEAQSNMQGGVRVCLKAVPERHKAGLCETRR